MNSINVMVSRINTAAYSFDENLDGGNIVDDPHTIFSAP